MVKYKKLFLKYWGLTESDYIECWIEGCSRRAVDIDHIEPRNKENLNDINNLFAICRPCHQMKGGRDFKERQKDILNSRIKQHRLP